MYVKDLNKNLLSVQKLEKNGFTVLFNKGAVLIKRNNILFAKGKRINGLYVIEFNLVDIFVGVCNINTESKLWHYRFRHISSSSLNKLSSNGMVNGLNLSI